MTDTTDTYAPLEITIENFRGVKYAKWKPEGVCALVGPNGSGKSTILSAFLLLHYALKETFRDAVRVSGGFGNFRHRDSDDAVRFTVSDGRITWKLEFEFDGSGSIQRIDESFHGANPAMIEGTQSGKNQLDFGSDLNLALKRPDKSTAEIRQFASRIHSCSIFKPWAIDAFRASAASDANDDSKRLLNTGANVAAVLESWNEFEHTDKLEWVRAQIVKIYPTMIGHIDVKQEGPRKYVRCFAPGEKHRYLPLHAMSNGVIACLFALVAVAGAPPGATLMFDEADNGLHPSAIAQLVTAIHERAEATGLTVVFATHSLTLLDHFNDTPEDVWVADAQKGVTRLTDQLDRHWLNSFRLGTIYGSAYGRQVPKRESTSVNEHADSFEKKDAHEP